MPFAEAIGLLILIFTEGAQLVGRSFLRRLIKFFWMLGVGGVFGYSAYVVWLQYRGWRASPFSKFFLPPYQPSWYFFSYVGWRVFAPWLFSLAAAYAASRFAGYWNARKGGRFFEPEETKLFALGIFLSGYPGFLFYFLVLMISATALSSYYHVSGKGRAPLYYLWLPAAIFAILIKQAVPSAILNNFIL